MYMQICSADFRPGFLVPVGDNSGEKTGIRENAQGPVEFPPEPLKLSVEGKILTPGLLF
jgi:hypothetical protein